MILDQRAAAMVRSKWLAILCTASALVCFAISFYFWDEAVRLLDLSAFKPAASPP
jgi:hypothetical protein